MKPTPKSFAVLGLGRFGKSVVETLAASRAQVLAVDLQAARIDQIAFLADRALVGDASDPAFLKGIGIESFDVIVLAMGSAFEASVLATMSAKELGAKKIVVKAVDARQAQILKKVGADQVVLPEVEMGAKIAQGLLDPTIVSIFDRIGDLQLARRHPDQSWVGKTIAEADIRNQARLEVIALIRAGKTQTPVNQSLKLADSDVLVTLAIDT